MTRVDVEVSRLLAGWRSEGAADLAAHRAAYGPLESALAGEALIGRIVRSGLRGRGGAGFPTGRKLAAVAAGRRRPIVVANGCEGEPASAKDRVLLERLPHLVLDGAALAASAVGAKDVVVCVSEAAGASIQALRGALGERRDRVAFRLQTVPERYVASEESALVNYLNGGPAIPVSVPPRPFERGVKGRPTLMQNVETLAHVALIARHGSAWFRELGTPEDPGSTLVSVSGAVRWPGVFEIALGTPLAALLAAARPDTATRAVLLGGYFGTWVEPGRPVRLPLAHHGLRAHGASLGCGVVVVLGAGACGICETAAVIDYLATESAGQCGPCVFGLRAIAGRMATLGAGAAPPGTLEQLQRWAADVDGRGACHHPDGAVRLLRSALDVFGGEAELHQQGVACRHAGTQLGVPPRRRVAA